MKSIILSLLLVASSFVTVFAQSTSSLSSKTDSISYALGMDVGRNLKNLGVEFDLQMLYMGMQDAVEGSQSKLSPEEFRAAMQAFQMEAQAAQQKVQQQRGQEALVAGQKFLAENKTKEGVTTTASGLQYKVLSAGSGASPLASSKVKVHYEGRLLSGKVFDSSYERGQPMTFGVGQVIRGWTEALQLMKPGDKWEVYIPSELGYGARGAGQDIGPNETLIFTVELLEIL